MKQVPPNVPMDSLVVNTDWAKLPLFDRKGWKRVRFGDVVDNLNETERDPAGAGIERFIAMEHLEPGSLHVREWGNVADGTTFNRRCRPGQVLFGKRRAYQRKVAVAEFDAVVSGDIYVFAPNGDQLLPELLPFLCMSERFFNFAVETSAGSLSPRTNWSSLAGFEFTLPSPDQQRRIGEIITALADALVSSETLIQVSKATKTALQQERLSNGNGDIGSHNSTLRSVTKRLSVGLATSVTKYYRPTGVPLLRNQNIRPLHLDDADMLYLALDFANRFESKKLKARDVITTRTGVNIGQTCLVPKQYAGAHSFTTLIVTCDEKYLLPEYLVQHMNAEIGLREIQRLGTSGGKGNLNVTDLAQYRLDVPPLNQQMAAVEVLTAADDAICQVLENAIAIRALVREFADALYS